MIQNFSLSSDPLLKKMEKDENSFIKKSKVNYNFKKNENLVI